jgi:beta-phosphoglucomutase-like phosphatase (HAD superfamily)
MRAIQAVLLEPAGCLAEFQAADFIQAARQLSSNAGAEPTTGSQAYWRFVKLLGQTGGGPSLLERKDVQKFELQAVDNAELYEDVTAALHQLRQMDVKVLIASSLSRAAVDRFLERFSLRELLTGSVTRDEANDVMAQPLLKAAKDASLDPARTIYLTDAEEGLIIGKEVGMNVMLMINDHDEGHRLAGYDPAGGIVSLIELPDGLRLIAQQK